MACCTSNATERPLAPLALQQRGLDTETGSYLPMKSSLCVCVFGRDLRALITLVIVGMKKVT